MNYFNVNFTHAWLLLLIIPSLILGLYPFFRLPKNHRRTRYKIVPTVLHSITILLTILLLSGLSFQTREVIVRTDVIILEDVSSSNDKSYDLMDEHIQGILEASKNEYNVGIVTFANGVVYAARMSNNADKVYSDFINNTDTIDKSATDISSALSYAESLLPNPKKGRIILLSDGLETDGNALQTAKAIAEKGIAIDVVYFNSESVEPEVQVNSIEVPLNVAVNNDVIVTVTLQSKKKGSGTLILFDGTQEIGRKQVIYTGDIDKYQFTCQFASSSINTLHAEIVVNNDVIDQNNNAYTFLNVNNKQKVLIVDGTGNEAEKLNNLIASDYEVDIVLPNHVPNNITNLIEYSEIILMNVSTRDLPTGFDSLLVLYVNKYGGGLFTVGGSNTYYNGYMAGTFYEQILPIDLSLNLKNSAIMLVMDKSSSMVNNYVGLTGKTRLQVAKEAAITCVNSMSNNDYVGVVTFANNSEVDLVVPLTPVTQKTQINQKINNIINSNGTQYYNAIDRAANELNYFSKATRKHIIFMSDGSPTDPQTAFESLVSTLPYRTPTSITFSTIAIGADGNFNADILENLSTLGQGRFYNVTDITNLSTILMQETKTTQTSYENLGTFTPVITSYNPSVRGITKAPDLTGYIGVTSKATANVVLTTSEGDPLYVERQYGSGKVGSFMSDLNGSWSANYFTDVNGKKFIKNTINSLLSYKTGSDILVEFEKNNYSTIAKINTVSSNDGDVISASSTSPSGKQSDITVNKVGENSYIGLFETKETGLYTITVTKKNSNGVTISDVVSYTTFSYSKEYNKFTNAADGNQYLIDISANANGKLISNPAETFLEGPITIVTEYNPQVVFIIIAIILFLLDLIARKFKFKWPHEWFKKKQDYIAN